MAKIINIMHITAATVGTVIRIPRTAQIQRSEMGPDQNQEIPLLDGRQIAVERDMTVEQIMRDMKEWRLHTIVAVKELAIGRLLTDMNGHQCLGCILELLEKLRIQGRELPGLAGLKDRQGKRLMSIIVGMNMIQE